MRDDTFTQMDFQDLADDALSIELKSKYASVGVDSDITKNLICTTIKARDLDDNDRDRAPVDIIIALDVSGSMMGKKLDLCKKTLEILVRCLSSDDKFGLVTYSDQAIVTIPPKLMSQENKEDAIKTIKSLHVRGSTNISDAIGLACQELRNINNPNEVRVLFLLTDGHANVGIIEPNDLVEMSKNCLSCNPRNTSRGFERKNENVVENPNALAPITMHAFGYGEDHNAILLRDLAASTSGGSYYFVDDDTSIGTAFGDALGGALSVVAQSVVLSIKPSPTNTITKVFHDQATKRDNGVYTVTVGDFYAEETRDIVFEIDLIKPVMASSEMIPHVSVSLTYTDTINKMPISTLPVECSITRPPGSEVSDANKYVLKHWLRIDAVQKMKEAEQMCRNQKYGEARVNLQKWQAEAYTLNDFGGTDPVDMMFQEVYDDMTECIRDVSDERRFKRSGQKQMLMKQQCHMKQRSAMPCSMSTTSRSAKALSSYATSRKKKTSNMFLSFTKK